MSKAKPLSADEYAARYTLNDLVLGEWRATAPSKNAVQLTLWDDHSMKWEEVGRANEGKTTILIDQAGEYAIVEQAPPSTTPAPPQSAAADAKSE
jgi:hypothetical protein